MTTADATTPGCRPFVMPSTEPWPYNVPGTAGLDFDAAVWTAVRHIDDQAGRAHMGLYAGPRDQYVAWAVESRRRAMHAPVDPWSREGMLDRLDALIAELEEGLADLRARTAPTSKPLARLPGRTLRGAW